MDEKPDRAPPIQAAKLDNKTEVKSQPLPRAKPAPRANVDVNESPAIAHAKKKIKQKLPKIPNPVATEWDEVRGKKLLHFKRMKNGNKHCCFVKNIKK